MHTGRAIGVVGAALAVAAAVAAPGSAASGPAFSPDGRWLLYTTGNGATSWLADADGADPARLAGAAARLADGRLAVGTAAGGTTVQRVYTVRAPARLVRTGSAPSGAAEVPGTGTYVVTTDTLRVAPPRSSTGVIRIETAQSASGPRTLWYEAHVRFTASSGLQGTFPGHVTVLPDGRGLLLTISHYCCDYADGQSLFELRTPVGRPVPVGVVLSRAATPSFGPDGTFALGIGDDRYAWAATEPEGEIGQPQIAAWYATHHLFLLAAGAKTPADVPDTEGAAAPVWSKDSEQLLYVEDDALYLIAQRGARPVEVAGPLFPPDSWGAYYGEVDWASQFAWSDGA